MRLPLLNPALPHGGLDNALAAANQPRGLSPGNPLGGVNELIALAKVFNTAPTDLLIPIELVRQRRARELVERLDPAIDALTKAVEDLLDIYAELFTFTLDDPELYDYVMGHWYPEGPTDDSPVTVDYGEGPESVEGLERAVTALYPAIIDTGGSAAARAKGVPLDEKGEA